VLTQLADVRFVAVVGASGCGKSSFLRAGVLAGIITAAHGGISTRVVLLTPGERPINQLATTVSAATDVGARVQADELRSDPGRLTRATRRSGGDRLVIAIDQFEAVYAMQ
jgi:ABC-type sulfate/molybdate transport systems ATPase subunit